MSYGVKQKINIEELYFDPQNPRLPISIQGDGETEIVIQYMVRSGNITELMKSIAELGYSDAEPLLVVKNKEKKYIVVEGNRRLAALKLLNDPSLTNLRRKTIREIVDSAATKIPTDVPCIIYENRLDILDYLGYRHITGVKDWGALEKARYLDELYRIHIATTDPSMIYQKLAKMIGSRSDYVKKIHVALQLFEKANEEAYYGLSIDESKFSFSWIPTALGYTGISEYIEIENGVENINSEHFKNLFCWMFDSDKKIISDSRKISELASVLESKNATEKMEHGASLEEAILFTEAPSKAFLKLLTRSKVDLQQARDAIEQLQDEPEETTELLDSIERLCKTIRGALFVNFNPKINKAFGAGDTDEAHTLVLQILEKLQKDGAK